MNERARKERENETSEEREKASREIGEIIQGPFLSFTKRNVNERESLAQFNNLNITLKLTRSDGSLSKQQRKSELWETESLICFDIQLIQARSILPFKHCTNVAYTTFLSYIFFQHPRKIQLTVLLIDRRSLIVRLDK